MQLRSLAIILPLYYCTISTSTFATVSTNIPSNEAICGRMPLHYYHCLISDTVHIGHLMNYPLPTCHDMQSMRRIYRCGSTDCRSEVSSWVDSIVVTSNRDNVVRIPDANRSEPGHDTYVGEIVHNCQRQIADATRLGKYTQLRLTVAKTIQSWFQRPTSLEIRQWPSQLKSIATNSFPRIQWLTIATSIRFDKSPSDLVDWRYKKWLQSPYVSEICVTCKAEAGHWREVAYELNAIHVDPHRWRQLTWRLPCRQHDGVIYVTVAAKSVSRHIPRKKCAYWGYWQIYAIPTIHI
jgi:hypothetical protein